MTTRWVCGFMFSCISAILIPACPDAHITPRIPERYDENGLPLNLVEKVDLLFVIDNSGSMREEQDRLASEIPKIVRALLSGDVNRDGISDINPIKDIHAGVVSTDLGSPIGESGFVCEEGGDHGVLKRPGGRGPRYVSYLEGDDQEKFVNEVVRYAAIGFEGCPIERPLGALAQATATSDKRFFDNGTGGKANKENAGFLRDDALLTVVMISDEEDCSSVDQPILFSEQSDPRLTGVQCQRCAMGEREGCRLTSVDETVLTLLGRDAVKEPAFFVFSAIVGLPSAPAIGSRAYDAWLGNPEFVYGEITWAEYKRRYGTGLLVRDENFVAEPVCALPSSGGFGDAETVAAPGRRFVEFAKEVDARGGRASVHSICDESFERAITDTATDIADVLAGSCLPQRVPRDDNGMIPCQVQVTMPFGTEDCAGRPGLRPDPIERRGDTVVCSAIQQAYDGSSTPPTTPGWYYEENPGPHCPENRQQRIHFVDPENASAAAVTKPDLALARAFCDLPVPRDHRVTSGTPCLNDANICDADHPDNADRIYDTAFASQLACSEESRTCQIVCDTDQAQLATTCPQNRVCYRQSTASMALIGSNRQNFAMMPKSGFCFIERRIEELD